MDTLPDDVRHALEVRWQERLAFDLLAPDTRRDCIDWIEKALDPDARHRRIEVVLDLVKPSPEEPKRAERRYLDRLEGLRRSAWRNQPAFAGSDCQVP
jgi:hypothetical protein